MTKAWILCCLLLLGNTHAYPLDRESCEHFYCPEHVFAKGTDREHSNCSEADLEAARPYLHLIPKAYESTEQVCGECGTLMEDEGFECELEYDEEYDLATDSWIDKAVPVCYEPEDYWCPYDCVDAEGDMCGQWCKEKAWDAGYFCQYNQKYYSFFLNHLKYCAENPSCQNLWPELGGLSSRINNLAYQSFKPVVKAGLIDKSFNPDTSQLSEHGKICSLVIYLYFYSQYHQVFSDVIHWVDTHSYRVKEAQLHIDSLYKTLDQIQIEFLELYNDCITNHPHPKLFYERGLVYFHQGEVAESGSDIQKCLHWAEKGGLDDILLSELYHHQGELYFNTRAYDQAIAYITRAIMKNPARKDYHLGRASAYLEIGEFDLALADFFASGLQPSWAPDQLAHGDLISAVPAFTRGIATGIKDWSTELIPALITTSRGIAKAFWAVYPFPGDDTYKAEMMASVNAIINYVRENHDVGGLALIPEFRDLIRAEPGQLTNEEAAYKIGHMIGKYGADVLTGVGIAKIVNHCQSLKRINTVATLEACAHSSVTTEAIAAQTAKHAAKKAETLKKTSYHIQVDKQGKHIRGHQFFQGEGVWEGGDPKAFISKYRGKGVSGGNKIPGTAGYRETVDAGEIIGLYHEKNTNQLFPTTRATIHYAQDGCHIVPSQPKEWLTCH